MATKTLKLSSTQIGTLTAVTFSASLSASDLAAVNASISDDQAILSNSLGPNSGAIQGGIIFNAVATTGVGTLLSTSIASPSTATIAAITPGQYVFGFGLAPGTRVTQVGAASTVHISPAPVTNVTGYFVAVGTKQAAAGAFQSNGFLNVPNRGVLKVLPGDVVATGPSGEVILLPKLAISFAGSPWILS